MNSKDLRAIQHVKRLTEMGVSSLKIEGRTKSHFYAARTAQLYRQAIDDACEGRAFDMGLMDALEGLANRGYTEGFYRRHVPSEYQRYDTGSSKSFTQQFCGEIEGYNSSLSMLEVDVKNRFSVGDNLELMTPAGNRSFKVEQIEGQKGEKMDVAPGSGYHVRIPAPEGDYHHALLMRNVT